MSTITIAMRYGDRSRLFSRLVCWWERWDAAHCEVVIAPAGGGWHYCVSASLVDGGVRAKTIHMPAAKWRIYEVDVDGAVDPRAWLRRWDGAWYDVPGLLGFVLPVWLQVRWWWFCSEVAADICKLPQPYQWGPRRLEQWLIEHGRRIQ
jgi:hypothetical protein